jgi:hypothetical protein
MHNLTELGEQMKVVEYAVSIDITLPSKSL